MHNHASHGLPSVSVITPVFNGSQYLDDLILSVKFQINANVEHIIIDDGSDDGGLTVGVLKKYPHLKWWTRPNKGQYATLNEGLQAAEGDWICIISADDVLASPSAFSELLGSTKDTNGVDALYGKTGLMDSAGNGVASYGRPDESAPRWVNYHFLVIHHCSMLVSRRFIHANQLWFDTTLRYTGDWDWIIRILKLGRTRYVDMVISRYRVHEQQTRQTTTRKDLVAEDRLVLSRHGLSAAVHDMIVTYFRLKKLILILAKEGGAGAVRSLKRFVGKK